MKDATGARVRHSGCERTSYFGVGLKRSVRMVKFSPVPGGTQAPGTGKVPDNREPAIYVTIVQREFVNQVEDRK